MTKGKVKTSLEIFEKALQRFEEALQFFENSPYEIREIARDSAIKRFEVCFDTCWKALKLCS